MKDIPHKVEFRRRKRGTTNQIGKVFPIKQKRTLKDIKGDIKELKMEKERIIEPFKELIPLSGKFRARIFNRGVAIGHVDYLIGTKAEADVNIKDWNYNTD